MSKEELEKTKNGLNRNFLNRNPHVAQAGVVRGFSVKGDSIVMHMNYPYFAYIISFSQKHIVVTDSLPYDQQDVDDIANGNWYSAFESITDGDFGLDKNNKIEHMMGICKWLPKSESHLIKTPSEFPRNVHLEDIQGQFEGKNHPMTLPYLKPSMAPSRAPSDAEFRQYGAGMTGIRKRRKIKSPKRLKL